MGGGRPTDSEGFDGWGDGQAPPPNSLPQPGLGIPALPGITVVPVPYGEQPAAPAPADPQPDPKPNTDDYDKSVSAQLAETDTEVAEKRRIRGRASTILSSKSGLGEANISRRTLLGN